MNLHQVFTHPNHHPSLAHCCEVGDAVLLLQDGVYAAAQTELGLMAIPELKLYVLENDLLARGITPVNPHISVINDEQWLALCVKYNKVISWN